MLPLLFAGMTAAAQNQDMARLGTYMSNGEFVVGTAETVLAADITVRCEKIVCGPYARYAQKFLGLRAPLTDKTVYTVADAAIALMPGERYVTAGELPASTCRVESYEAQGADFARLQTDRLDMTETDLQTAARNAAAAIFSLRKHRLDLISGEAGENVFGAGLPVALERLDRLEQEYLELFLGRRVVTTETRRFRVTPAEGKLQQIVCRFSPDAGLLPANDLTGDIVLLQYEPQGMAVDEAGGETAVVSVHKFPCCLRWRRCRIHPHDGPVLDRHPSPIPRGGGAVDDADIFDDQVVHGLIFFLLK